MEIFHFRPYIINYFYCLHVANSPEAMLYDFKTTCVLVRVEVFTAVTMKNAVFWDVTSFDSYKSRHFGVTYDLHRQGALVLVTANVPSLPILTTDDEGDIFLRNDSAYKSHTL
jgi:hypothetical protein